MAHANQRTAPVHSYGPCVGHKGRYGQHLGACCHTRCYWGHFIPLQAQKRPLDST